MKKTYLIALIAVVAAAQPAIAQSNAGREWSDSWSFGGSDAMIARLAQAEAIERVENDYWKSPTYYVDSTTIVNADNYVNGGTGGQYNMVNNGQGVDITSGEIGGNSSTTFGAYNNSSTEISIVGDTNTATVTNGAKSEGCQNGSINITSSSANANAGSFSGSKRSGKC
jgi:hypothetical protein